MPSLTMDDIDELWTAMREDKSWRALKSVLDYRRPEGVSSSLADDLSDVARKRQGEPFPGSKRDLYDLLRNELR
jgi:hypothetical protein